VLIEKHIGCARYIYNYALGQKIKTYELEKKSLSQYDIMKQLPLMKKQEETCWLKEVNSQSLQHAVMHVDSAYVKFFREKKGFPKFKSKHDSTQSFQIPQKTKVDFEIKDLKVYANNYHDFIVIDFANINSPLIIKRNLNQFSIDIKTPDGLEIFESLKKIPQETTIISYEKIN
jgi:transposase